MDENGNKYGYLDHLSTEQLEEILCADFDSQEDSDTDMILYITEVIERREKEHPTGRLCDVNEAWKEFQEHYMDLEGPLYPMSDSDEAGDSGNDDIIAASPSAPAKAKPAHKSSHRIHRASLKWVLPIAAVVALLLAGMITAQAAGFDVFGALAKWTDDTFRFVSPQSGYMEEGVELGEEGSYPSAQELHDAFQAALDECSITEALAPTWFPEGCVMVGEPDIILTDFIDNIICTYEVVNEYSFVISVQFYDQEIQPDVMEIEKDAGPVEEYLSSDRLFYFMTNNGNINAVWSDGECLSMKVFGNVPEKNVKQLLDSIGV